MSKNKYQEALDNIKNIILIKTSSDHYFYKRKLETSYHEDCDALQELISKQINFVNNQLTKQEIEAILICMSYYSLRNEGKLVNNIDVGFGGELYSKLKQLSEGIKDE